MSRCAMGQWALGLVVATVAVGCGNSGPEGAQIDPSKMPKPGSLSGRILVNGEGLAGAEITLNSKIPGVVAGAQIRSGADGQFTWGGPAGTYEVVVKSDGKEILRQTVSFKEGDNNPPITLEARAP